MKPRICATIANESFQGLLNDICKAEEEEADMIEIRFDFLNESYDVEKIRASTEIPLIATNRRFEEGGRRYQKENERIKTLINSSMAGFEFIDLELSTPNLEEIADVIEENGSKLVISFHDFNRTPEEEEFENILNMEESFGAYICKIVGMAKTLCDNFEYLKFVSKNRSKRIICFGMGEYGIISRVLSPFFGAYLTFASVSEDKKGAPGQISISKIRSIYRCLES
ncbi:MAG: type I 3-dehydroquinate dehydratase [Candidatus Bathyarchaeia archaeon]